MIIKDINNMLDRQGIFSFASDTKVEKYLTENNLTAIVRMRIRKDKGGFMILNFENDGIDEEEVLEQLKEFNPKISPDAVMLKLDTPEPAFLEGFRVLNKVPSVVIDAVVFNGGNYYLYFRFHSSDENSVTSALRSKMAGFKRFAIRYLGKSAGIIASFKELSLAVPLRYVEILASVPPKAMRIADDPVLVNLGVSWTREMKYVVEDEIRAVYYDKASLLRKKEDWINEISREHRIYETAFSNPVIQRVVSSTSENAIVTLGMPQRLQGKTFSFATVVPEIVLPEFFSVLYETVAEFKDWELDIHIVDLFDNMAD